MHEGSAETTWWAGLAPFHESLVLASARHTAAWQLPAQGPVPVFEVLRDGTWILDGTWIPPDAADRLVTMRRLLYEQARRMPRVPLFEQGKRDIPANPLFLRADLHAPWSAVRPVLASCAMQGIELFDVDLQVHSDEARPQVLRFAAPRVIGIVCYNGLPRVRSFTLEAGTPLQEHVDPLPALPVHLELRGREFLPEEAPPVDSRFRDVRAFVQELRRNVESLGVVEILLPESAPAWVAILAVDLATEAGFIVEAPALSLGEMEGL